MGIIYGGFAPNGLPSNSGRTRNYCALLLQPPAGNKLEVLEFNPAQLTVQQCANRAGTQKPCFDAVIRDLAVNLTIKVRPQEHLYEVFMQDRYRLRLIINGDPVPWSTTILLITAMVTINNKCRPERRWSRGTLG
jgi:hypothetical protein